MRIVVVGPGALGLLFATILGRAGHDAWLLDYQPERAAFLAARGIWLEEKNQATRVVIKATAEPEVIGTADLILLCVKSGSMAEGLDRALPLLASGSLLIAFQNGISHPEICRRQLGSYHWAVGTTSLGAALEAADRVRHGGEGMTMVGFLDLPAKEGSRLGAEAVEVFNQAGITAQMVEDIQEQLWRKLLINVGINALTALNDCANGRLLELPNLRGLMIQAVEEAAAVARAKGIDPGRDPVTEVLGVCLATRDNTSSMLQDIRRRKPTEIGAINGALVAEARRLGIPVPVNEALVRAVRRKEQDYRR
jgi:2-dehydropantoate 2-reductase